MTSQTTARRIRSTVDTKVTWIIDGTEHEGHSHDLSLNGVYIASDDKPAKDTELEILIYLPGDHKAPRIKTQATVIRSDESGFAVNFKELDYTSYDHLKNLVAYQNEDPNKVLEEQEDRPGIK